MSMRLRSTVAVVLLLVSACVGSSGSGPESGSGSQVDGAAAQVDPFDALFTVASPDTELRIEIGLDQIGRARYRVVRSVTGTDEEIVQDSTLGLETSLGSFAVAGELSQVAPVETVTDTFSLPHGKARVSTMTAQTQTIRLGADDESVLLDVWVADTAVAFRYRLEAPGQVMTIDWERTSFALPASNRAWMQPHDPPTLVTPAYERLRSREATAGSPGPAVVGWTFPALFASEFSWTLVTEAGLADGAAGSHFSPATVNGEYLLDFASRGEGNGVGESRPTSEDGWTSPWRVIITSTDLGDIVESDAVRHLTPGSTINTADWIHPGRVSWSWWSDHTSSRDAEAIEPFIDLAGELGWEYSLVDANWTEFGRDRLAELASYAADRNVGLFVWYNSGGPNNAVTEAPRDRMTDQAIRRQELAWLAEIGVRGIKVDFFQSDKPVTIQQYRDILSDAADFEIMVNFHGSTIPRGWDREFPNLMTMEAVRGGEIYTFVPSFQRVAPRQNTVLPFTRNVVGSMDYTPVILGDHVPRRTTNGHELALTVVFESALLHLVDTPDAYLSQPEEVIDLLATVPTFWDETQFVAGEPESHVVIARRHGDTWWIGAINGLAEETIVVTDLSNSLGVEGELEIVHVCDNAAWEGDDYGDPGQYVVQTELTSSQIRLPLVAHGGCLVRLHMLDE